MPELPEVEIVRRQLEPLLVGSTVTATRSNHYIFPKFPCGTITRVWRHGKWIIFRMEDRSAVMINLGMSGRFVVGGKRPKHVRWEIKFRPHLGKAALHLQYVDPRCMGRLRLLTAAEAEHIGNSRASACGAWAFGLGVDALSLKLAPNHAERGIRVWRSALENTSIPIKRALMDQSRVAGLGNIYAAEACWLAKVHPDRPANKLTVRELNALATKVQPMLRASISMGGTSFGDANSYRDMHGVEGKNVSSLHVYGRVGQRCLRCKSNITSYKQGSRTTFYCPGCQK